MPNKDRHTRRNRKERQQKRQALEAAQQQSEASNTDAKQIKKAERKKSPEKVDKKPNAIVSYFKGVKNELRRVTWPTKLELREYSVAVIFSLIVFGVGIWLVDTGIIALLVGYTGLRSLIGG